METFNISYREVLPDLTSLDDWNEVTLNTGTQSTLQDIKVSEKSGGYCYCNGSQQTRNRFIYWRAYQNVLELSEISLDFNLYQNNLRYVTDSPVISVSIVEQGRFVTLLVVTVCSLHRIVFPHPDVLGDGSQSGCSSSNASGSESTLCSIGNNQSFSIFRDANSGVINKQNVFYVIEGPYNLIPHAAASHLSPNGKEAYFALAYQSQLMLYVMSSDGSTISHQLKEHTIMPRLFSNIKGAITGKNDSQDADCATSITFNVINEHIFLVALYRNDMLRMWSTRSLQNVCTFNCLREHRGEQRIQGPQNNALRKINETNICAFLSHSMGSEFICIEILNNAVDSSFSFAHRRVIQAPHLDLADFEVSEERLWALWSNAEGEFSVSSFSFNTVASCLNQWVSSAMEPPPDRCCVGSEQGMDAREAYCSYIFHPGKFDRNVISKALHMFRRSEIRIATKHCTMALLKEHVCQVIEEELLNEFKDCDITDDEYADAAARLWERFYSGCEQYYMKACQPTGLFILQPLGGVCVVKKNAFSLLRPCEPLEHLILAGSCVDVATILNAYFPDNQGDGEDMIALIEIISQLQKWLSEDVKSEIDKKLYQLETPRSLISKLVSEIFADNQILPSNFLVEITQKLQAINDVSAAIELLLSNLRIDNGAPEAMLSNLTVAQSSRFLFKIGVLFGSSVGLSVLSETVRQSAMIRFTACRNLLILQQILIDTYTLSGDILERMRSNYVPDAEILLQAYYAMVWISESPVNLSSISSLETATQRLNLLQLITGSGRIYSTCNKTQTSSLLRVFLNAKGLYTSLALYTDGFDVNATWHRSLITLSNIVSQLIWPVSYNFTFGEWILSSCQHILIEDYVRLLNSWCEWNLCSRQFILAISLLDCGEAQKAYDLFIQSAKGVQVEYFLTTKILKNSPYAHRIDQEQLASMDESDAMIRSNQATAQFYLKVIQLFEQHSALDHIISMAQVAIGLLESDDPQLPMFQSIVFNNHLQLEHYEEAYHALIYNAEPSRRKDCLRQLVMTLFSCKRQDLLMHFPYVGLHDEFENIVETRARSLSIEENDIYDFLYAFHVNNGNMRKASAAMYEQAMRLQLETDSIEAMKKRCDCLAVCINALHLIDIRYRWIAKPVIGEDCMTETIVTGNGNNSENTLKINEPIKEQVVVLEIKDISQELLQSEALVRLVQNRKDVRSFLKAGPQELSLILASCGMFTNAIKLAKGFHVSLLPVFDSLTSACVRTGSENANEAWAWLQENDLADIPQRNNSADMVWSLLEKLVKENEEESSTIIRKCVVNKLLSLNAFVPQWLLNSYKLDNCSELLRLFVAHNRLLEASELSQEMIKAMLGSGSEYFSFKHSISFTAPDMCLPIGTIDLLLHALKLNATEDVEYKQAHVELEEILQKYVDTCIRTAEGKKNIAFEMEYERQQN